jgi:hypothetical protein
MGGRFSLRGNSVRLPISAFDPHGAVLSAALDQARSGGHRKAAGPMSVAAWHGVEERLARARRAV